MTSHLFLELSDVNVVFDGKRALSSLSLSIHKGEKVAIIGPSGAGKSTLLNVLSLGLTPPSGGIFIDGETPVFYKNRKLRARKIGVIRQQFDLIEPLPVIHNVLAGRLSQWSMLKSLLSLIIPQDKKLALDALAQVGIEDKWATRTEHLSGGEKQRVALARLLLQNPELIVADEPVASLDPARAESVLQILTSIIKQEQTLVTSLHSVEMAKKFFSRIIGLREGEIVFDLPPNLVTKHELDKLYKLEDVKI